MKRNQGFRLRKLVGLARLAVSLTFGSGGAYAFPNNPCHGAATSLSSGQLFWLMLPVFVAPIG